MTVRNVAGTCLLFARALGGQVQTPEKSPTSCVNGGWSTPRELHTGEGYSAYVKQPSIMPMRGAAFIAGFPALSFDSAGKRSLQRRAGDVDMDGVLFPGRNERRLTFRCMPIARNQKRHACEAGRPGGRRFDQRFPSRLDRD